MKFIFKRKKTPNIIDQYNPESPSGIECQRLFKMLFTKGASSGITSLMVTSSLPQEGKSILIGNMALVAAGANQRTVIIDADMRRPVQSRRLHLPLTPGLSNYLQKEVEFDQILYDTKRENLKLIPSGNRVSSPSGLLQLSIPEFKALLNQCQMFFDVVFVDTPPVIPVNDSEIIAPLVDGVVLIVMAGKTYREIITRTLDLLGKSNCNLIGMILNNLTTALPYYYSDSYYYSDPIWGDRSGGR